MKGRYTSPDCCCCHSSPPPWHWHIWHFCRLTSNHWIALAVPLVAFSLDFNLIRTLTEGKIVFVSNPRVKHDIQLAGATHATKYYLAGSVIVYQDDVESRSSADFIITHEYVDTPALFIPRNHRVFLYDSAAYDEQGK